ncbi:MAG: DUF4367 domain-containing protein [Oscillospiraceae bacterium]|nr:DUF4367 domain-containing protein [Oscillospiraceae bacterium]
MENNKILTRESLEQMSTKQLDETLQAELRRDPADEKFVRLLLSVLKEREAAQPREITPESSKAWEDYQQSTGRGRPARKGGRMLKASAAAAVVLAVLGTVPQQVEAENFFGRLISWTDSIFELLNPIETKDDEEYIFETAHPGLQEVYDTLVELGVTQPVVPQWLPEGYELIYCKEQQTPVKSKVTVSFENGENQVSFKFDVYKEIENAEYQKDETVVETIEMSGIYHSIIRNNDMWVAVWVRDNIECCIFTDCQKEILVQSLRSIYEMEGE